MQPSGGKKARINFVIFLSNCTKRKQWSGWLCETRMGSYCATFITLISECSTLICLCIDNGCTYMHYTRTHTQYTHNTIHAQNTHTTHKTHTQHKTYTPQHVHKTHTQQQHTRTYTHTHLCFATDNYIVTYMIMYVKL